MIQTLADLRQEVKNYINRPEITDAQIDTFIDNGRRAAAMALAREQENSAVLTLDGALSAPLPTRFLAARAAFLASGQAIAERNIFGPGDLPGYLILNGRFSIVGDVGSEVESGDLVTLTYYEFPEPLVNSTDTNAYLIANSDLWLWASIQDAGRFLDAPSIQKTAEAAIAAIGERIGNMAHMGRQYGGPRRMQVRG